MLLRIFLNLLLTPLQEKLSRDHQPSTNETHFLSSSSSVFTKSHAYNNHDYKHQHSQTLGIPPPCGEAQLPSSCEWPKVMPAWPTPVDDDATNNALVNSSALYLLEYPEQSSNDIINGTLYASCFMRNVRKPLFTMHKLDRTDVFGPCRNVTSCSRDSTFHNDQRFCYAEQDINDYYYGSNFDRGHLTPNAAFGIESERLSTFRLTNIVPQSSDRNRHAWENLETMMRDFIDPGIRLTSSSSNLVHNKHSPHPHQQTSATPTYDILYVYTGAAYTLPNAQALSYAPVHEFANTTMYFPIGMYKVAVCVNSTENSAIVMACWSDNPNGAWPRVPNSNPLRLRGPYGEHVAACPKEQAYKRCVPWQSIGTQLLSDECFEPQQQQWTVKNLLDSGLSWENFIPQLSTKFGKIITDRTCF